MRCDFRACQACYGLCKLPQSDVPLGRSKHPQAVILHASLVLSGVMVHVFSLRAAPVYCVFCACGVAKLVWRRFPVEGVSCFRLFPLCRLTLMA